MTTWPVAVTAVRLQENVLVNARLCFCWYLNRRSNCCFREKGHTIPCRQHSCMERTLLHILFCKFCLQLGHGYVHVRSQLWVRETYKGNETRCKHSWRHKAIKTKGRRWINVKILQNRHKEFMKYNWIFFLIAVFFFLFCVALLCTHTLCFLGRTKAIFFPLLLACVPNIWQRNSQAWISGQQAPHWGKFFFEV